PGGTPKNARPQKGTGAVPKRWQAVPAFAGQAMKGVVLASTPASPHTPRRDPPAGALRMLRTATAPSRLTTAAAMAATTSAGMPLSTTGALGAAGAGLTSALGAAAGAGLASALGGA